MTVKVGENFQQGERSMAGGVNDGPPALMPAAGAIHATLAAEGCLSRAAEFGDANAMEKHGGLLKIPVGKSGDESLDFRRADVGIEQVQRSGVIERGGGTEQPFRDGMIVAEQGPRPFPHADHPQDSLGFLRGQIFMGLALAVEGASNEAELGGEHFLGDAQFFGSLDETLRREPVADVLHHGGWGVLGALE